MQKSLSELAIPDAFGSTVLALETLLGIVNVMIDEVTKSRVVGCTRNVRLHEARSSATFQTRLSQTRARYRIERISTAPNRKKFYRFFPTSDNRHDDRPSNPPTKQQHFSSHHRHRLPDHFDTSLHSLLPLPLSTSLWRCQSPTNDRNEPLTSRTIHPILALNPSHLSLRLRPNNCLL